MQRALKKGESKWKGWTYSVVKESMAIGESVIFRTFKKIAVCIFIVLVLLALLKPFFPEFINESFIDKIQNLNYVSYFCAFLTFIIIVLNIKTLKSESSLQDIIIGFIFLVGLIAWCSEIFFWYLKLKSLLKH